MTCKHCFATKKSSTLHMKNFGHKIAKPKGRKKKVQVKASRETEVLCIVENSGGQDMMWIEKEDLQDYDVTDADFSKNIDEVMPVISRMESLSKSAIWENI